MPPETPAQPSASTPTSPDLADSLPPSGVSRRSALVGGAAAVWSAPVVTVVAASPAFAVSGARTVTASSPSSSVDAYVGATGSEATSGDPTQVFTVTVTEGSTGTGAAVPVGTAVTFTLSGADTTWLRLVDPASPTTGVVSVTTVTDALGRASVTVRYLATTVPVTTPATVSLIATLPGGGTGAGTGGGVWAITYRQATPGGATALGALALVAARGGSTSLAIRGGRAYGWGANTAGQIGNGAATTSGVTTPLRGNAGTLAGKTITALDCFSSHALFLAADNTLHAVGLGTSGQLGNSTTTSSTTPVRVVTSGSGAVMAGKTIVAVAAGGSTSYALASDGAAYAWGERGSGRLGDNNASGTSGAQATPVTVVMPTETVEGATVPVMFTAIAAGNGFAVALSATGNVYTWGGAASGRLGNGATGGVVTMPTRIAGDLAGKRIVAVAAGQTHTLALGADGAVYAWGLNTFGQVGNGTTLNVLAPTRLAGTGTGTGLSKVIAIAAGGNHSHAVAEGPGGATVRLGWGDQTSGGLGDSATSGNLTVPTKITEPSGSSLSLAGGGTRTLLALAAGNGFTLALAADGTRHAWGINTLGQVGNGTITNSAVPVLVTALP